ncbi:MAG: hypothetical protein ACK4FV_03295 [Candidatus Nitrosocaldus sp.]
MYTRLVHRGLSQAEVEALFNLLNERFEVIEEVVKDEQQQEGMAKNRDGDYDLSDWVGMEEKGSNNRSKESMILISVLSIDLPIQYDMNFVKSIGFERWEVLKEIIKNIKWRRGKGRLAFRLKFLGPPTIVFSTAQSNSKVFNKAIEAIEYVIDTVLFRSLPDAEEVRFVFSSEEMRWYPRSAYLDGKEYRYIEGVWSMIT